MQTYTNR